MQIDLMAAFKAGLETKQDIGTMNVSDFFSYILEQAELDVEMLADRAAKNQTVAEDSRITVAEFSKLIESLKRGEKSDLDYPAYEALGRALKGQLEELGNNLSDIIKKLLVSQVDMSKDMLLEERLSVNGHDIHIWIGGGEILGNRKEQDRLVIIIVDGCDRVEKKIIFDDDKKNRGRRGFVAPKNILEKFREKVMLNKFIDYTAKGLMKILEEERGTTTHEGMVRYGI